MINLQRKKKTFQLSNGNVRLRRLQLENKPQYTQPPSMPASPSCQHSHNKASSPSLSPADSADLVVGLLSYQNTLMNSRYCPLT